MKAITTHEHEHCMDSIACSVGRVGRWCSVGGGCCTWDAKDACTDPFRPPLHYYQCHHAQPAHIALSLTFQHHRLHSPHPPLVSPHSPLLPSPSMAASMDAALGALLGAAVGDSCGSYLEFLGSVILPAELERALLMRGGGCHRLQPGQITDDTELALALTHALLEAATPITANAPHGGLPASCIARWYGRWMKSPPFDVGNTCAASMKDAQRMTAADDASDAPAKACMAAAERRSMGSKANGALMRCTPIPILYHRCSDAEIAAVAAADARLSHPNPTCQLTNALYAIAIAQLIRTPDSTPTTVLQHVTTHLCSLPPTDPARLEVQAWLDHAVQAARGEGGAQLDACHDMMGFVKHAFVYAFYHLVRGSGYEEALRHTLAAGGDTDTNAAIVCGLVGAAVGANGIPERMRRVVLECEPKTGQRARPEWLWPTQIPALVDRLYHRLQEPDADTAHAAQPSSTHA